jgi:plasmid rolling circle replication initiator protein Rep
MNIKNCQQKKEKILKDFNKSGKYVNWREKKMSSLRLADSYKQISKAISEEYKQRGVHVRHKKVTRRVLDRNMNIINEITTLESAGLYDLNGRRVVNYEKRAENIRFCGSMLDFVKVDDKLKLIKANFCKVPLCPMCQWRKSMRIFFEVSKIMSVIEKKYNYIPVFLTLTVRNCSAENLGDILDDMFSGWHELMRSGTLNPKVNKEKKHIVQGWFRALEITYNDKTNEFHPHFHVIMLVEKNYFKSSDYLKTEEWVQLWRKSAKLDYDPVCDIRRTRNIKGKRKEVAEVAKYTYKDAEILNKKLSDEKKTEVIKYLSGALHQRRLYAYGGVMKDIAAELKIKDIDKADLVNVNDEKIDSSLATMILRYRWNMGISNYVLVEEKNILE